jgi:hypothetical protein
MDTADVLLLAYVAFGGEVQGKTKLQKKLYFLSIMMGQDFGFGPHYYGPYSAEVASANSMLKSVGYLSESIASAGSYNSEGFEIARHDFRLTEDGRAVADHKRKRFPGEWEKINRFAVLLNSADDLNYMEISIAAKAYFLLDQKGEPTRTDEVVRMARQFGWSVTEADIIKAVGFLEQLSLAKRAS